ncbi:MAG: hypothetical protein ABWY96_09685 [Gaiellaceae bacterium]
MGPDVLLLRRRATGGTLEAVDFSEKDGSLVCIAQVRVTLKPPP